MSGRVVLGVTKQKWNESKTAMKLLLHEISKNKNLSSIIVDNVTKINANIFTNNEEKIDNENGVYIKLTDKEFDTIMNEIDDEQDANV